MLHRIISAIDGYSFFLGMIAGATTVVLAIIGMLLRELYKDTKMMKDDFDSE